MVKISKRMLHVAAILLIAMALGIGFLSLVYALPTDRMKAHIFNSMSIFYTEEVYPQQVSGYKMSQLDNETDAVMILNAIHDNGGQSIIGAALENSRIDFSDEGSFCRELIAWVWEGKTPDSEGTYERYWHGYLVVLKPLLLIMDYADIRILNMIVHILLMGTLIMSMAEYHLKKCVMPFLLCYIKSGCNLYVNAVFVNILYFYDCFTDLDTL